MKAIGLKGVTTLCEAMAADNATHVLESKVIPYRMFDRTRPVYSTTRCQDSVRSDWTCAIERRAGIGGQAGRMDVGVVKSTLINWQSCTDSGRDHKKKELCGRAVGLRYHWNGKSFVRRPGIDKMILLLDGSWRDEDLKVLLRVGWDEMFYPDEMDRLIKSIV